MLGLRKKRGFTLVEIMIVVGIIIILAALSIHSLLRAKINANDGAAVGSVKSIAAALESYRAVNSAYTDDFTVLSGSTPSYLSTAFADESHQGYDFYIMAGQDIYTVYAQPEHYGVTGTKFIVYDQTGLQRFDDWEDAEFYVTGGVSEDFPSPPLGYN